MNEITVTAMSGAIIGILFTIIVYFMKQLVNRMDVMYESSIAQKEINKTLFTRLEKMEKDITELLRR